ncbi:zinc transporter ZIP6 isoform X2 [Gadus macrocephalus]|uniref:zinc transporter ZIP6 isoform X2 n=1 Tax=Gadus macrocephalus TaxID=80720 RepID=UPI0028CB5C9C|nr:zinc transporter ZIP6 isoform X2 [Gadus macrocephalus]
MRRRRASGLQNREKTVTKSRTQSGVMIGRRATAVLVVLLCLWGAGVPSGALAGAVECPTTEGVGRSGADMPSAVVDIQKAESSQRHHLEALFNRYGENGTISLASLKSLLHNIGLDRVRTVTVQQRHHHHHGDHHHGDHPHGDDAHNLSLKLTDSRPSMAARLSDSPEQQAPSLGRGPGDGHRRADGDGPTGRGLDGDHHHQDHDDHDDPHHDHDDHHRDPLDQVHRDQPLHHHHGHNQDTDHQDQEHHDGHHRLGLGGPDTAPNRSLGSTECQNASEVLRTHGMARDVALTLGDFRYLCPALLHQISSGSCILHREPAGHGATAWAGGFVSITVISLLSLLGVVLIPLMNKVFFNFLLSFLVALAVGTLSGDAFLHLIPHSQATHNLHHHHHNHHEVAGPEGAGPGLHGDQEENLDGVWKGLTALSGVYVMFLIEHFLTLGKMYKDRKKIQKKWDSREKDLEEVPALEENHLKPHEDAEANGGGALAEEQQLMLAPAESAAAGAAGHARPPDAAYTDQDCEHKCHSHFHDTVGQSDHHHHHDYHHILHHHHSQNHHPHSHAQSYSQEHFEQVGVAALAWMVIVGDGLHNFSDGLAIGAAFSEGLSSGLSTSVAVFCHELPHELGDFAVLLKSGMTVRQAILYNVLSAMMAYLGMGVGIVIGHYAENVSMWIFALTAGLFMYVALVDMMPEMLHNNAGEQGVGHCGFFLLQNAGILLGFAIMLLIAVFEHKIQLDLGY